MQARPLPIFLAALVCGVAGGAVASFLTRPDRESSAQEPEPAAVPSEIERTLASLAERQSETERTLAELRDALARAESGGSRLAIGEIDAAVARALAELQAAQPVATAAEPAAAPKSREERVRDAIAALEDENLSDTERQRLWREFAKEGLADAIVAEYERRAELDPTDPDKKVELGHAYLQKIFEVGNSPEAGTWAMKADKAFDNALELDPEHWEARFSKAVSLSFWPPVFGKQNEAIQHFETLVSQQSGGAKQPEHAQVHLLLGNMYQQIGKPDQALSAWERGLSLFPDDAQLKAQLDLVKAQ